MILIEPVAGVFEEKGRTFEAVVIPYDYGEVIRQPKVFDSGNTMFLSVRQEFWLDDDKSKGIELAMVKETKNWNAVFPFGDVGQNRARVGPNDISYIKTRF